MSSRASSDSIYLKWSSLYATYQHNQIYALCTVLLVSQSSERHSYSLVNEIQLIVTTSVATLLLRKGTRVDDKKNSRFTEKP